MKKAVKKKAPAKKMALPELERTPTPQNTEGLQAQSRPSSGVQLTQRIRSFRDPNNQEESPRQGSWQQSSPLPRIAATNQANNSDAPRPPPLPPQSLQRRKIVANQQNDDESLGVENKSALNWLQPDQLSRGKAGLKSSQQRRTVHVERDKLFDIHETYEYFPLRQLRDAFPSSYNIDTISLIGVDQVTDLVLFCLHHIHRDSMFIGYVKALSLNGNVHITDVAIPYIIKLFPNLEKIRLKGCKKITNDGITKLALGLKKLQVINVHGCDVSIAIPLGRSRNNIITRLHGCPQLVPSESVGVEAYSKSPFSCDLLEKPPVQIYKVVILTNGSIKTSLLDLVSKTKKPKNKPIQCLMGWKPKTEGTFTILQCPTTLYQIFSTARVIHAIPFSLDEDINKSLPKVVQEITQIMLQQPAAVFCLTGVTETGEPVCTVDKMLELVIAAISTSEKSVLSCMKKHLQDVINHLYVSSLPLDFKSQQSLSNLCRLSQGIEENLSFRIKTCTIDCQKPLEAEAAFSKSLAEAAVQVHEQHPVYKHLPEDLLRVIDSIKQHQGIQEAIAVAKTLREKLKDTYGANIRTYVKMLELMSILGRAVLFEVEEKTYIVTHLEWFDEVMSEILCVPSPSKDCHKCLHPDTPVISLSDLTSKLTPLLDETQVLRTVELLIEGFGLGFIIDKSIVLSSNLKSEPPVPLAPFLRDDRKDMSVSVIVNLHMPLPAAALHMYMGIVMRDMMPLLVWNRGVLIQNTPFQMVIQFKEGDTGQGGFGINKVTMHATFLSESINSKHVTSMFGMLQGRVSYNRVLLEYVLKQWYIPYTYGDKESFTYVATKSNFPEGYQGNADKFDEINLALKHPMHISKKNREVTLECVSCGETQRVLKDIWKKYRNVYPSFCVPKAWYQIGPKPVQQKGNWFSIEPSTGRGKGAASGINWRAHLDPESFYMCSIFVDAGFTPAIEIRMGSEEIILERRERNAPPVISRGNVEEEVDIGLLNPGNTIDVRISRKVVTKQPITPADPEKEEMRDSLEKKPVDTGQDEELMLWLEFLHGGEVVWAGESMSPSNLNVSIKVYSADQMVFYIDAPLQSRAARWEAGMRLEALDRKNPTLICVATVQSVDESGQNILIHFDGWTERYDYNTHVSSNDLHPIGYMAHRKATRDPRADLQAPHGYNKRFDWKTYLEEIDAVAVPYTLFSQEQTEGCPEYPSETAMASCTGSPALNKLKNAFGAHNEIPPEVIAEFQKVMFSPIIVLPTPLTMMQLRYPRLCDISELGICFLCMCNGFCHMLDMEPLQNDDISKELQKEWPAVVGFMLVLSLQKDFLPKGIKRLIKDADDVPHEELTNYLREHLMSLARMMSLKDHHAGSKDKTLSEYENICANAYSVAVEKGNLAEFLKKDEDKYRCAEHLVPAPESNLTTVPLSEMSHVWHLTTELDLQSNQITELPSDLYTTLPLLQRLLLAENKLSVLPGFNGANSLIGLDVSKNQLKTFPKDLDKHATKIETLQIGRNPLGEIPECIFGCKMLTHLSADELGVVSLPENLKNLEKLKHLDLKGHAMTDVPEFLGFLEHLIYLDISGIAWFSEYNNARAVLTRQVFDETMASNTTTAALDAKVKSNLFNGSEGGQHSTLDHKGIMRLNTILYETLPRIGQNCSAEEGTEERQKEAEKLLAPILRLVNLETLKMRYLAIREVPSNIAALNKLQHLEVSHCPNLEAISSEVVLCKGMKVLHMEDCANLKTPPKEIVRRGFAATIGYLKRLQMGSVTCKRTKLMMVGLGGAGKTSTIKAVMSGRRYKGDLYVTDGIDIMSWKVCYEQSTKEDNTIDFSVWDFAGQTVYYNTHQFFLSNRAVYLLMWNVRLGHEHAGLDFWLSSIACHAPKAPVLVIGTHIDQVEKFWLPQEALKKRFPQIVAFHSVSSYTGEGIPALSKEIYYTALKENYMGEKIPHAWLNFEKAISESSGAGTNLLEWDEMVKIAESAGIIDDLELKQSIRFLHDLGSLQHFENDFLKSKVVINPQWIVNVMSCVVSVHENAIKDGKILHSELDKVWRDYPKDLHKWLLRLTEEFDLTFPLLDEPANLVACLLPDKEPEFTWQDVSDIPGQYETKMLYRFDYLPAGLFNRAQVRLSQFSDSSIIWKKGSLLHKSGHRALMTQGQRSEVQVKTQGHCPENFLFLVHEVFETLIMEAYNGVTYDFLIPCPDCIKVGTHDPCMFEASKIRRATELKVPFLQCDAYFHTLSLSEIQALMPPDSSTSFDAHLERNLRDLSDLKSDMETDVFFFYCSKDIPGISKDSKEITPRKIYQDLADEGYKVWFSQDPDSINLRSIALTMKNSKLIVVLLSDSFVQDDQCCNVFYYAQNTLRKKVQTVVLTGNKWQKTDIGLQMAAEVYINMSDPNRYEHKKVELMDAVMTKTAKKKVNHPRCFISYCWSNSLDAIKKGSRKIDGALGWGDPRAFKKHLEDSGIACWMDIEQVGQGGLFEDIAEGLKHAKVVVACVSDEYAKSKNCQMELRFAVSTLKLPVIVVIVGTGYAWEASEVGMLVLGFPKINAQYESSTVLERIVSSVKNALPEEKKGTDKEDDTKEAQQRAFQELLELAQRKLLRQVAGYASSSDLGQYPRLFFIDFVMDSDKDAEGRPLIPDGETKDDRYVIRFLCEFEQGWHVSGCPLLVPALGVTEVDDFFARIAPFGARMMALLKHTSLDYPCLTSEKGIKLRQKMEDSCTLDMDFKKEYSECQEYLMQLDAERVMGRLTQCHMPNGKYLWLCKEHAAVDARISSVEDDGGVVLKDETPSIDLSQSQSKENLTQLRGKLKGAGAAARVAGAMSVAQQNSQTCSVM